MKDFIDWEKDYEPNDIGLLTTGEYFELIEQEYEKEHGKILDYIPGDNKIEYKLQVTDISL